MIASVISFIIKIGTSKRVAWCQYIQSNWLSIHRRLYYLMKQLISVTELKEYGDNIKTKTDKPFRLRRSKHMPKKHRYRSTDTLSTQKHHSQPTPNPDNPPSLKVHVYSHSSSSSSTLPLYLHGPHFLPSSFFYPPTISFQHTSYIYHKCKPDFSLEHCARHLYGLNTWWPNWKKYRALDLWQAMFGKGSKWRRIC